MSHTLPNWVGRLLGIDAASGEGVVWNIECVWRWPPWVTLLFLTFAAMLVVAVYLREAPRTSRAYRMVLAGLRFALVVIVLLMISQITLSLKRTGLPYVAVLIDDSLSMTLADHYDEASGKSIAEQVQAALGDPKDRSRVNLARTLLMQHDGELLSQLAAEYRLRTYFLTGPRALGQPGQTQVSDILEEIRSMKPVGGSTRLGDGVRAVLDDLRGAPPAAVVVLTDGINTEGAPLSDAVQYARRHGVPLFFIGLGSEQPNVDAKLSDLLVDSVVFVDDVVHFECGLTTHGMEGRKLSVVLRERDKPAVLATVDVTAGAAGVLQQVRLPYRPTQVGQFEYVVSLEPQAEELNVQTNRLSRIIDVRKEKIRVLLVQSYPSFEFRYLRNMLGRDDTIALNTLLQEADLEHAKQDVSALRGFPKKEELFAYDVVILGDADPSMLSPSDLQNLADFVDQPGKGGAMVFIAGPKYMPTTYRDTPLARLFPFDLAGVQSPDVRQTIKEGFLVQPTELGLASPTMQLGDDLEQTRAMWLRLPPLYWLLEIPSVKPGVRVLATASSKLGADGHPLPLICLQYVGAGKVLFHATDETWRWRWRSGDQFFARYWVQTIRYLCRSKLADAGRPATLSSDRREYAHDEPVRLRVNFNDERLAPAEDDGVTLVVEHAGRTTQRIVMRRTAIGRGAFEAVLSRSPPGNYHAWIAVPAMEGHAPAVDFVVTPPAGEFTQLQMNGEEMRQAAHQTGGQFYTFDTADRLLDDLPAGRQVPVESLPPYPLWNRWPLLAICLILLIAEWFFRKRRNMA